MARHIKGYARFLMKVFLRSHNKFRSAVLPVSILLIVTGCSGLTRNPVPIDRMDEAVLTGMPGVRSYWMKEIDPLFQQDIIQSVRDEPPDLFPRRADNSPVYSGLAISGGGANGAFGAGILCGWSDAGTRPRFKLVTGISTGALIAPYAFLGSAYDAKLRAAYTTVSTKDIVKIPGLPTLGSESLADSSPLADSIARDLDETMLADIAAAHARGQRLYIGTTHMDAQRFVVWNMGAIAASGHPGALALFRKIMLASASIPGIFPPVYIEVAVDGQTYDEMHVDGGVITQVFFDGIMLDIKKAARMFGYGPILPRTGQVYVIRNGKVNPEPQHMPRKLLAITGRSVSTMIKVSLINDLMRIYQFTQRDNIEFNYVGIPEDFRFESDEIFDPEEMNALFEIGYQMGLGGDFWDKAPIEFTQK
jgi:predicted patatin/cPLA2 family phospholipase